MEKAAAGRPPEPLRAGTPRRVADLTTLMLTPTEAKLESLQKRAALTGVGATAIGKGVGKVFGGIGRGIKSVGSKVRGMVQRTPPPPQVGRLRAGLTGAGVGAAGIGAYSALTAKPGERMQALQRGAVLGAGLGGAGGLLARGPINQLLAKRHAASLAR